jgi:hypothetical protein
MVPVMGSRMNRKEGLKRLRERSSRLADPSRIPRSFGGRFPCPRSAGVVRVGPGHGMEPPTEEARGLPIARSLYID